MSIFKIFNAKADQQRSLNQKLLQGLKNESAARKSDHSTGQLLEWGANPNARDWLGNTPLIRAVKMEKWGPTLQLLFAGANPSLKNIFGTSAISIVMQKKNPGAKAIFNELTQRVKSMKEQQQRPAKPAKTIAPAAAAPRRLSSRDYSSKRFLSPR